MKRVMLICTSKLACELSPLPRRFDQPEAVTGVAPCLACLAYVFQRPVDPQRFGSLHNLLLRVVFRTKTVHKARQMALNQLFLPLTLVTSAALGYQCSRPKT